MRENYHMEADAGQGKKTSLFERAGGEEFFDLLVHRFYDAVADDELLRPLYPDDLTDAKSNLSAFLVEFWGGPKIYSSRRGHPMLRARHLPFPIGKAERDAWVAHMTSAVRCSGADPDDSDELIGYFERAATHLINKGKLQIVPVAGAATAPMSETRGVPKSPESRDGPLSARGGT